MRIYAFHLLNDYSGSPKVLMQLVKGWVKHGVEVTIVTASGRKGFLSDLDQVRYVGYWYRWASNPFLRLINLTLSQLILFFKLIGQVKKGDIVYVNTVLPFGAAFLGKVKGCRIIYHVHETSMKPPLLKKFLFGVMRWAASDVIYVSRYLANQEHVPSVRTHILYNAIEESFVGEALRNVRSDREAKNILMVCSLKVYKGVDEFVQLASFMPQLNFRLVVNASQIEVDRYSEAKNITDNLSIFAVQTNLHPFYQWADVVLNLSHPDKWIETFGLTIIEGMAYGLPAIVPPVGGITELVDAGVNGYLVNSTDMQQLADKLNQLCSPDYYQKFHHAALRKINHYHERVFQMESLKILSIPYSGSVFQSLELIPFNNREIKEI
jgi:L-malate glycosyltransferase